MNELASGRALRAEFRADEDVARVYRTVSIATLAYGAAAVVRAHTERDLGGRERTLAAATGCLYGVLGLYGTAVAPQQIAAWFQRRPRRTFMITGLPLALTPFTGGARTPLYRLASLGVACAAGIRGQRRDGQLQSLGAGILWCAIARARGEVRDPLRTYLDIPLGFVLAARVSAAATQVAYDSRNLVDQLHELAQERESLNPYVQELTVALERMRGLLVLAAGAEPAAGIERRELSQTALASLARLEERRGVLAVAALHGFDLNALVGAASDGWSRRMRPTSPQVQLAGPALAAVLGERAGCFDGLREGLAAPEIEIGPGVQVRGLQRLALLSATVIAGVGNIVRHAEDPARTRIVLERDGKTLRLQISDEGGPAATAPNLHKRQSGLTHLREQIEAFGGTLDTQARPDGFTLSVVLPADSQPNEKEFWADQIRRLITASLEQAVRLAAIKSASGIAARAALALRARTSPAERASALDRSAAAQLVITAAGEALWTLRRRGFRPLDSEAVVLLASAAVAARTAEHGRNASSSWVNAYASRYAFSSRSPEPARSRSRALAYLRTVLSTRSQQRAHALTALNAVAALVGSRQQLPVRWRRLSGDLLSMSFGPTLIALAINPAQPRIRMLERAANERLSEMEAVHKLADSIHEFHPAASKIEDLAPLVGEQQLSRELTEGLERIEDAEGARTHPPGTPERLDWPQPAAQRAPAGGEPAADRLGDYLARALARRVWPATVVVSFDVATLRFLRDASVVSAAFRREAMAAMDIVGRQLNRDFARRWDGIWLLRRVELLISVEPFTGTLHCEFLPWAPPPRWGRLAVDWVHDRLTALAPLGERDTPGAVGQLLDSVGASLDEWTIHAPAELARGASMQAPASRGSVRVQRRGCLRVSLYPQRH